MSLITVSKQENVTTLGLNRPESLNAFTPDMLKELLAALNEAESDPATKAIILKGEGRAFSAGVDLKVLQGIAPAAGKIGTVFDGIANEVTRALRQLSVPAIAQVHGACFTGALEIALSCDFIIAEAETKFGDTHAQWGLRPTWGMAQNLARAVGVRKARQLSYSATIFSGQEAATWGLANEAIVGTDNLANRVSDVAKSIASRSTSAVNAYKALYRLSEEQQSIEDALDAELAMEFPDIKDTQDRLDQFGKPKR